MAYGILAPQPGTKPAPSGLEGRVLTAAPRGKSQLAPFFISLWILPLIFCSQWGQSIHDGQERSRVMVTVPSCVHVCGSIGGLYTEHRCPYLPSSIYLFLPSSYDESHSVQNDCSKNWGVWCMLNKWLLNKLIEWWKEWIKSNFTRGKFGRCWNHFLPLSS